VILEVDCSNVMDKRKMGGKDRSLVAPIISDALRESQVLHSIAFTAIGREQNKVAHELAHLAVRSNQCCVNFQSFLECVNALICNDSA
jgi:hypothetical protein